MTENESLREDLKLEIQSLLSTEKEAIPSRKLFGQYCSELGKPMPYAKLGYRSMDDFLRSIPDVVSSYYNHAEGMLYVKAVPLEKSCQMSLLIQQTPTAKKKKKSTMYNQQSLMSRFRTFRVSSQVAPNRDFNRNYSLNKPAGRFSSGRNGSITVQSPYSINRNYSSYNPPDSRNGSISMQPPNSRTVFRSNLPPRLGNQNQQAGPSMFSNNENIKNNKMFTKQNIMERKPFAVPLGSNSNITGQGLPGREHFTPQFMQPRTPAPQVVPIQTPVVEPTAAVIENQSAVVNAVQNSLMDLKISSTKPVDHVKHHPEQDSKSQVQGLPPKTSSPIKILDVDTPVMVQGKPSTNQAFLTCYMQRLAAARRALTTPEDERPRKVEVAVDPVPEMMKKEDPPSRVPLQTPRHLPDRLPSKSDPLVSPLLTRRLPFQPAKSVAKLPTLNVKPTIPPKRSDEFFCARLKTLVNEMNFGRVHLSHNQMKSGRFVASIKVGQEIFLTYPEDFDCLTDAYEYASKLAVEFLEAKLPTWMIPA